MMLLKRLSLITVLLAVPIGLRLASCSHDEQTAADGGSAETIDAGSDAWPPSDASFACVGIPDAGPNDVCNRLTQCGCADGEKCTRVIESIDPVQRITACVPDGSAALGEACAWGEPGLSTGFDDCAKGLECSNGTCEQFCDDGPPDTCRLVDEAFGTGRYCAFSEGDEFSGPIQRCVPACAPTDDSVVDGIAIHAVCGNGFGCKIGVTQLKNVICAEVSAPASTRTQNSDAYQAGSPDQNVCASGFGALVHSSPTTTQPFVCARYCTPANTHDAAQADAQGQAGKCTDAALAALGGTNGNDSEHQCRFVQSFYSNTEQVPEEIGMCVPVLVGGDTWGDCRTFDWDGIQAAWNGKADVDEANAAFNQHCLDNPSDPSNANLLPTCLGFFRGCISVEEEESKLDDYAALSVAPGKSALRSLLESRRPSSIAPTKAVER